MQFKIQYDALHRNFKLVDSQQRTIIEGDGLYDLAIPLMFEDGGEYLLASLPIINGSIDRQGVTRQEEVVAVL